MPDLAAFENDSVAIFSDYGGESCGRFNTYSALVCGIGYTGLFQKKMKSVREKHALREKEIAFKDFGMGALRRALPDYLDALDHLPGLLCTLVIDKRIPTVFGPQEKSTRNRLAKILEDEGLGKEMEAGRRRKTVSCRSPGGILDGASRTRRTEGFLDVRLVHVLAQRAVVNVANQLFLVLVAGACQVDQGARIGGNNQGDIARNAQPKCDIVFRGGVLDGADTSGQAVEPANNEFLHAGCEAADGPARSAGLGVKLCANHLTIAGLAAALLLGDPNSN